MTAMRLALLAVAMVAAVGSGPASAEAAGDPNAAKGLVVEHCSSCHALPGRGAEAVQSVEAPTFAAIAASPEIYSDQRLRDFLRQPHWPMARFSLSPSDIDNIIAYVRAIDLD